jgi:hypothetical protein
MGGFLSNYAYPPPSSKQNPPPGTTNPCLHSVFGPPQTQSRLLLDAETARLECHPLIMPSPVSY